MVGSDRVIDRPVMACPSSISPLLRAFSRRAKLDPPARHHKDPRTSQWQPLSGYGETGFPTLCQQVGRRAQMATLPLILSLLAIWNIVLVVFRVHDVSSVDQVLKGLN